MIHIKEFISLQYKKFGHPLEVLELEQRVDDKQLQHDEIVVRMILSPINPSDLIPIRGAYKHRIQLPAVPGYEGVGVVEAVGSSVTASLLGKRVLPLRGEGTWQQYVKTKANLAIRVPVEIDNETASQMYINPMTAWLICAEELRLKSDDVLIVNACGSAIGRIFAQFSKVFGYRLIAVVRNDSHTQELYSLGAWAVIDTSKELLVHRVLELTCEMGATAGIDSIGGQDGHDLIECIRPGGTVLNIGLMSGTQLNWARIHHKHSNIRVKPYWLRRWIEGISDVRWHETFGDVFQLVIDGELTIQAPRTRFSLREYEKAIIETQQSGHIGKVILEPFSFN
ncbi:MULTISPECIES: zinc-dependent alcohol dehydrogenase family protein [Paenibacillus]|uniref:zinc-dependent alcohol dehydrogenase family protein n=1 Tax=Paenibacillus TaxID=44249 RepID=UPI0001B9ECC9|nr:zinc-dependent alcohol dehydrogenase family protein [Paenibacillus sp. Y412MC10]ACX63225.1 Alcohol dehydrogenase GroES domain protein [Paenibacillus sp. Y412MC10]MCM3260729.1 zinc-dependent alcohol dehydrogenase family protein [Paenibacillus lautus]